jgi:hypothetical protein
MIKTDRWGLVTSRLGLYTALCEHASNVGAEEFRASQKTLADLAGLSPRSQSEVLKDLVAAGVIEAEDPAGGGQGQKTYRILSVRSEVTSERSAATSERSAKSVRTPSLPTLEEHVEGTVEEREEGFVGHSPTATGTGTESKKPCVNNSRRPVDDQFLAELQCLHSQLDVQAELRKAQAWLLTRPGRKLTPRFLTNWCARARSTSPKQSRKPIVAGEEW